MTTQQQCLQDATANVAETLIGDVTEPVTIEKPYLVQRLCAGGLEE